MKSIRDPVGWIGFACFALALGALGFWLLFSTFAFYDDEGYILMSARDYHAYGRLYDLVYSQYGPAFYAVTDAVQHLLRTPVDHTLARGLTLGCWLAAAAACAAVAWEGTASRALALFTFAASFLYLHHLPDEPFHPGSFIVAVLAVTTWLLTRWLDRGRWTAAAALAGATGALLLLTKINVGVFHLAAIGAWALLHAGSPPLRRLARPALIAGLPLLAAAVMHTLIAETWIHLYLAVFSAGAVTVLAVVRAEGDFSLRQLGAGVAAAVALAAAILAAIALRGTSAAGLLDGALLGPLRHPGNYSYAVDWRPGTLAVAALSLALAPALPWLRRRDAALADRIIVGSRIVQIIALGVGVSLLMQGRVIGAVFSYMAPLLWTWIVPLGGDPGARRSEPGRVLLALILLLQYLHAYPVGGSQESWGTFLLFPLAALGLGDLRRRWREHGRRAGAWRALGAALAVLACGKVAWAASDARRRYAERRDLALPGAGSLRLDDHTRTLYRTMALNASVHADVLFSMPGMHSFNLWSDVPAPTSRNTTLWFSQLDAAAQHEIMARLRASPRAGVIVQEPLVQQLRSGGIPVRSPLVDYLHENFALAFRVEEFAFLVHSGRRIAPLNLARVTPLAAAERTAPGLEARIEFALIGDQTPIASIGVAGAALRLDARNARVIAVGIDRAGNSLTAPAPLAWPLRCPGLTRVAIDLAREDAAALAAGAVLQLRGDDERILHEVKVAAAR